MADIKDTVGEGSGQVQDIAMVQVMLKVIKDAKGAPYLKVNYSGKWNAETKDAIARFQADNKLVALPPDPAKGAKGGAPDMGAPAAPAAPAATEKEGVVAVNSSTLKKLNSLLPADYKEAMILPGGTTVYFPGNAKASKDSSAKLRGELALEMKFRMKAADFVDALYQETKIVVATPPRTGTRRDFQSQMNVNSQAGPGESNHQFGQAADIGFPDLKWVDGDGTIRHDDFWLGEGSTEAGKGLMTAQKKAEFWKAHHTQAFGKGGLSPTTLAGDDLHVQAYADTSLSYSRSLTHLLNKTGKMKWEGLPHQKGQQNKYKSDFNLGGKTYDMGTAKNVFGGSAKIDKADVAAALNASKKDLAKLDVFKEFEIVKKSLMAAKPGKVPDPITGDKVTAKDITEADLDLIRKAAKADWAKVDQNWKNWVPVK